ncbi:MAG: hypothetical protein LAO08_18825 [Acidobacteriia bacterium]|nr:hypothetical protein [Terriglobia bacterium]
MRQATCPQEADVLKSVRTGIWSEALSAHMETCADCKELVRASRWMQALAQSSATNPPLPDAARVWWRAQLSDKQAKAERAQELFEWSEIISASVICAALAVWIVWHWSAVQFFFASILAGALPHSWLTASPLLASTPAILFLSAVIVSLAAAVLAYPILARD